MSLDQKTRQELKKKLMEEKALLESDLSSFAKKDPGTKDNWETVFPEMGEGQTGSHASEDEAADEIEEFENLTAQERSLESRLAEVNRAISRFDTDAYGICRTCKKEISLERLKANPAAGFDMEHTPE